MSNKRNQEKNKKDLTLVIDGNSRNRSFKRYLIIVLNVIAYIAVYFIIYKLMNNSFGVVVFLIVVFHVAWFWGLKPAIIAVFAGLLLNIGLLLITQDYQMILNASIQGIIFYSLTAGGIGYLRDLNLKLKQSYEEIENLRHLLPICYSCKKIRNDGGYWMQLEEYFDQHQNIRFSHGLCPECGERIMRELDS